MVGGRAFDRRPDPYAFCQKKSPGRENRVAAVSEGWQAVFVFYSHVVFGHRQSVGGVEPVYSGWNQLVAVSTMLLIGYVEEFIFRGLLFSAMLSRYDDRKAIIISSITFGIGHIVNLLTEQLAPETFIQVIFAVAWGFILTMVVYRSKSLWPAIVAHGLVDAFSVFSREQAAPSLLATWIYPLVTIAVALVYCSYLSKLKPREPWDKERLRP